MLWIIFAFLLINFFIFALNHDYEPELYFVKSFKFPNPTLYSEHPQWPRAGTGIAENLITLTGIFIGFIIFFHFVFFTRKLKKYLSPVFIAALFILCGIFIPDEFLAEKQKEIIQSSANAEKERQEPNESVKIPAPGLSNSQKKVRKRIEEYIETGIFTELITRSNGRVLEYGYIKDDVSESDFHIKVQFKEKRSSNEVKNLITAFAAKNHLNWSCDADWKYLNSGYASVFYSQGANIIVTYSYFPEHADKLMISVSTYQNAKKRENN